LNGGVVDRVVLANSALQAGSSARGSIGAPLMGAPRGNDRPRR
jgi:hypothetical protein